MDCKRLLSAVSSCFKWNLDADIRSWSSNYFLTQALGLHCLFRTWQTTSQYPQWLIPAPRSNTAGDVVDSRTDGCDGRDWDSDLTVSLSLQIRSPLTLFHSGFFLWSVKYVSETQMLRFFPSGSPAPASTAKTQVTSETLLIFHVGQSL